VSSGIFPTDQWTFAQGHLGDNPVLVRYRQGNPAPADKELFSNLIMVSWVFEPADDSPFPTGEIAASMEEFEDRVLTQADDDAFWGSGVAVVTTPGRREWRFYTPDPQVFVENFSKALSGMGPYPIELEAFADPDWNALEELRNMAA